METIDGYIPVTKAKNQMLEIIRDIGTYDNTIAITKNGLPHAVMMSMEHYDALQETMAVLADTETMMQLRDSMKELKNGEQLIDLESL
ncbi:MAG: hypothetical protein DRH06_07935 [Deltaproteobacteria bacterium]|nr:MAG: hypothetical protein DRH06_07935 [Deltaproteobacteria bacterium]